MKGFRLTHFPLLAVLLAASCTSAPVADPAPIVLSQPFDNIHDLILDGMAVRGWYLVDESDGLIVAENLVRGKHRAVVAISYTDSRVSIRYRSSENLEYDPESNTIHRNYNSWAQNLRMDIEARIRREQVRP